MRFDVCMGLGPDPLTYRLEMCANMYVRHAELMPTGLKCAAHTLGYECVECLWRRVRHLGFQSRTLRHRELLEPAGLRNYAP